MKGRKVGHFTRTVVFACLALGPTGLIALIGIPYVKDSAFLTYFVLAPTLGYICFFLTCLLEFFFLKIQLSRMALDGRRDEGDGA